MRNKLIIKVDMKARRILFFPPNTNSEKEEYADIILDPESINITSLSNGTLYDSKVLAIELTAANYILEYYQDRFWNNPKSIFKLVLPDKFPYEVLLQ